MRKYRADSHALLVHILNHCFRVSMRPDRMCPGKTAKWQRKFDSLQSEHLKKH